MTALILQTRPLIRQPLWNQLLGRGKVTCQFDELTINTARNRFVRATLEAIAVVKGIRLLSIH